MPADTYASFFKATHKLLIVASFPGSPSFRAIIPRMTFDPPEGKAPTFDPPEGKAPSAFPSGGSKVIRGIIARKEGEPGNEAT